MKKSTRISRPSRPSKGPIRLSSLSDGGGDAGPNHAASTSERHSRIPHPKARNSSKGRSTSIGRAATASRSISVDRTSRHTVETSSMKPPARSKSCAPKPAVTPSHRQYPINQTPHFSNQRSRSGERGGPFSNDRFSSLGGVSTKRGDSRPINDKGFQRQAMQRVYEYFQRQEQHNVNDLCPAPNSRAIMIKTFVEMMAYLLKDYFPDEAIYVSNYVLVLPDMLKKLRYPGNVSTSWLKTANAPHAWCHIVAILSWLVDLKESYTAPDVMSKFFVHSEEDDCNPEDFMHYLLSSTIHWNEGNNQKCDELSRAFLAKARRDQGFTEEDVARAAKEIERLEAELNDPEEQREKLEEEALVAKYENLCKREEALIDSNHKTNVKIEKVKEALKTTDRKFKSLGQQNCALKIECDRLRAVVVNQPIDVDQAEALRLEDDKLVHEIQNNEEYKAEIAKLTYQYDLKLSSIIKKLGKECIKYNTAILSLPCEEAESLQLSTNFLHADIVQSWQETDQKLVKLLTSVKSDLGKKKKRTALAREQNAQMERDREAMASTIERQIKERESLMVQIDDLKVQFRAQEEEKKKKLAAIQAETTEVIKSFPDLDAAKKEYKKAQQELEAVKQECKWILDRYEKFRVQRDAMIARVMSKVLDDLQKSVP